MTSQLLLKKENPKQIEFIISKMIELEFVSQMVGEALDLEDHFFATVPCSPEVEMLLEPNLPAFNYGRPF